MTDTERRLARFFAEMWEFRGSLGIDDLQLEDALLRSGFAHVRPATAEEAEAFDCDVGDEIVGLTDEGRRIVGEVR